MYNVIPVVQDPQTWADTHFADLDLGDKRRNSRAKKIAELMAINPGASIPGMTSSEYEMKATYNLFSNLEVTPDKLQVSHREYVRQRASVPGQTVLFFQDLTTISFSGRAPIKGLATVGDGSPGQQGYHIQSVLTAKWDFDPRNLDALQRRPPLEIIGLADQQFFTRIPRPEGEGTNEKSKRLRRHRESDYWGWATERMRRVPEGCDWVRVADAEADIHPFLTECIDYQYSFVVRAGQNRALSDKKGAYLFDTARQCRSLGQFQVRLRGRDGKPARLVSLNVGSCRVSIRAPYRVGGKGEALGCNVLRVWEENAPEGEDALEWILLTDRPVDTYEQALEVALMYCGRWVIEEFHKVVKTGMGIERLQLETGEALMAAGAIMSIVALRLLELKENVRVIPDEPAERSGLSQLELKTLETKLDRKIITVRDAVLAVAALGGHKGRKCDGMPGWQTLWQGMSALSRIVEGVLLSKRMGRKFSQ